MVLTVPLSALVYHFHSGPYGIGSGKAECPLSHLIEARFTDYSALDKDYPDVQVLKKRLK
jgi:hypothetical protein